ncbi:MAG TPA: peptide MFS transporter [Flavobacteriaceae bacterium]|nr:peptide MFS transporter [Flavobacteriaceae bacterium]
MSTSNSETFFKTQVLGHPAGMYVLFFTEMWERFSFYGMRVLLVNFLTMALIGYNPGWSWSVENAGALFGTYVMLLYITPILGGIIADRYTGYRWAVVIGCVIMTAGHGFMALETEFSLYFGLGLIVIGTGFFKPTITSIISEMYKDLPEKKDGAYTLFYMGVNAGAFFGMMLCGYLAERIGWSWGFGLAGIFMLLGTLQFWFAKPLFGTIGEKPKKIDREVQAQNDIKENIKRNPFTSLDKVLIAFCSVAGLLFAFNDPLSKIGNINIFNFEMSGIEGQYVVIIVALIAFFYLSFSRVFRYEKIIRDRMIAFIIFAVFTIFFWMSFEQGASSLIIFARDSVQRELFDGGAFAFKIINMLLTIIPLLIVSWVLFLLWKKTFKLISFSNITLVVCFGLVWWAAIWMLNRDFNSSAYEVSYQAEKIDENTYVPIYASTDTNLIENEIVDVKTTIGEPNVAFEVGDVIPIITKDKDNTSFGYLNADRFEKAKRQGALAMAEGKAETDGIVQATVTEIKGDWVEITVSWFSILNSFFIIAFASLFTKWWDSKYNPTAATKYALGFIIMAIGFGLLAYGSHGIQEGVKVTMVWLILAYLFHTLGELCLSPIGLSYVSKLVPGRMIALMFGMWYLAIAIGNKLAATLGGQIENITEQYSLSTFFLIFTIIPAVAGLLIYLLNPVLKKLMHGVH